MCTPRQKTCARARGRGEERSSSRFPAFHLLRLGERVVKRTDVVERHLGIAVHLAGENGFKAAECLLERHIDARKARELFGHERRLGQKALDLSRAVDRHLVRVAQLLHAEDGDDILQFAVFLQGRLHAARDAVVPLAHDVLFQNAGGRFERVNRGI